MKKKRLLFTSYYLDLGGIETALVNLLKMLDYNKYEVTLILEKKEGIFLNDVPKEVKVEEYRISSDKNVLLRKIKNRLKLWNFIRKNKNKYDFSACFATYSIPGSILARTSSKNNCMWIHSNYFHVYHQNEEQMKKFFHERKVDKFKNLVFVATEAEQDFLKAFPNLKGKTRVINNYIDSDKIKAKANEKIEEDLKNDATLLFVGRLEERAKRLTRLIEVVKLLKEDHVNVTCLIVGDGPDEEMVREKIKEEHLEQTIKLLGRKQNPYPYFKRATLVVLTSDYEGFPVTCLEAMILDRPFLSTIPLHDNYINLSDYGMIAVKDPKKIKDQIKDFLENGMKERKTFDSNKYQQQIKKDLECLIEGSEKDEN